MDISEKILAVMQQRGINKKELAEKLGIPPQGINSTVLNNPKFNVLERVAEALDVSLADLMQGSKAEPVVPTIVCPKCGEVIPIETTIKKNL